MTTLNWRKPIEQRFWSKVQKTKECWMWTGTKDQDGYGVIANRDGPPSYFRATHVSLMLAGRPLPAGMHACHSCDNPACVNPDHLWAGTNAENTADRDKKGRHARCGAKSPRRGADHPMAVHRAEKVQKVRELAAEGRSQHGIARALGMSQATVWNIIHGKQWRHI